MADQLVLTNLSKAGGVGKTTIAVNLAYEWSLRGYSVLIIDLDLNHSIEEFVGLAPQENPKLTSLVLFASDFNGDYPITSIFDTDKIGLIQGHPDIEYLEESLYKRKRREYILAKVLKKFRVNYDLVIIDLPGGFNLVTENVIAACNNLLIPVHIGVKTLSVANLIDRVYKSFEELELEPEPNILGLLPNHYDKNSASDNEVYDALPNIVCNMGLKLYPPLHTWRNLKRSATNSKPLKKIRSNDPMGKIFSCIVDDLIQLLP